MRASTRIETFLRDRITAGDFPGASYLVADGGTILAEGALGRAVVEPEIIPAGLATLYDLASLTKPLSTALLAALLRAEGALRLEDCLAQHLPEWSGGDERDVITLHDLLTHRSGLPAWAPLYVHAADRAGRIAWLRRVPLLAAPGIGVTYSDLGYILLGFALERTTGRPLEALFAERVTRPLGIADLLFRPVGEERRRIAATEAGNARERQLAGPDGDRYNGWRSGMIWGEVHDQNAWTLGGAAGHAGLFGTARAVHALALQFLDRGGGLLEARDREMFRVNQTAGSEEGRSVGFQLASTRGSAAADVLPGAAFGHTGFTGTSLWIDADRGLVYILLTNRVHPRFREFSMNAVRRDFHRLAATL
jgi:CubicO group peptidase (beta-lactamase class C family)